MPRCTQIQEAHTIQLLKKKGVIGTAVGEKWVNGIPTGQQAVLVFVQKKFSNRGVLRKFSSNDLVPSELDGFPTDVIEVGIIKKHVGLKGKVRPIKPGYSVGHGKITAGTIGGIFRDRDNHPVILSNNHVLANENNAKIGDIIYQPGPTDARNVSRRFHGWPDPVVNLPYIATLKKFVRLKKSGNVQDSAIAKIHSKFVRDGLVDDMYPIINSRLTGFANAKVGSQVQKLGRTTDYTTGRVVGVNASFSVEYDFGVASFNKCVVLSAMSKGGDSGSIIQDMNERAVALLFAGSSRVTIANPMNLVQSQYGLKLWTPSGSTGSGGGTVPIVTLGDGKWVVLKHSQSTATIHAKTLKIHAKGNHHCCLERRISRFSKVQCIVNTGTDGGATWGPGLTIQWPNGYIKVNLRAKGAFGGYLNGSYNINIGKTKPNTDYGLRIRRVGANFLGEIRVGEQWIIIVSVPTRIFPHPPTAVRIGKTDLHGRPRPHSAAGKMGDCVIKDFTLT